MTTTKLLTALFIILLYASCKDDEDQAGRQLLVNPDFD